MAATSTAHSVAAVLTDIDHASSLTEGLPVHRPADQPSDDGDPQDQMSEHRRAAA